MDRVLEENRDRWQILKDSGRIRVYRNDDKTGRPMVIKVYELNSWMARRAFRRKQRMLDRFYAKNRQRRLPVPELEFAGLSGDGREGFFCYDFLSGRDLRQLEWERLPEVSAISIMKQAGQLLRELHQQDWVHGDFKFGNLLFDEADDSLYLLDVEAVKPSRSTTRRARDLARFLLNGLELVLPVQLLEVFWAAYHDGSDEVSRMHMKAHVRHWLSKLGRRHRQKYGRRVSVEDLTFL